MDIEYFRKINDTYNSESRQETDLYLLNRHVDRHFADTIDYHKVLRNGESFELLIMRDTDNNTYKKKIKSRHGQRFNLGDDIEWNGQHWIVMLVDSDDKTYNSGYMYLCTILLRWQNEKGEILERWVYSEDYTKYSTGVSENFNLAVGEYQYGVTIGIDDETKLLKRDKRFAIDIDGVYPPDVYRITNRKTYITDDRYFGRGGLITLTLSYDVFNPDIDKMVTLDNGDNVIICNYIETQQNEKPSEPNEPNTPSGDIYGEIADTSYNIILGRRKVLTAHFYDSSDNSILDIVPEWTVECDFDMDELIEINKSGITISLRISDEKLIGEFVTAILKYNDVQYDSITLEITDI